MNLWMDTAQTRWTARHKQHIGQEACFFAGGSVGTKLGTGIAQASIAGIMSLCGYISSTGSAVVQSQSAINSIINIYMFGPLLIFVGVLIVGLLYQLDKKYPAIMPNTKAHSGASPTPRSMVVNRHQLKLVVLRKNSP